MFEVGKFYLDKWGDKVVCREEVLGGIRKIVLEEIGKIRREKLIFEIGKEYRSNNGDKLMCKQYNKEDNLWMFAGDSASGHIVIWCRADGRPEDYEYFGPMIEGPWIEDQDKGANND